MSNGKPLSYITYILFERHNLFTLCSVAKNTLASFLWFLDIGYFHNPYVSSFFFFLINCKKKNTPLLDISEYI